MNPAGDFRGTEGKISEVNSVTSTLASLLNLEYEPVTPTTPEEMYKWSKDVRYVLEEFRKYQLDNWMPALSQLELATISHPTSTEGKLSEDGVVAITAKSIDKSSLTDQQKEDVKEVLADMDMVQKATGLEHVKVHEEYDPLIDPEQVEQNYYIRFVVEELVRSGLSAIAKVGPGRMIAPGGTAFIPAPDDWFISRQDTSLSSVLTYNGNFSYLNDNGDAGSWTVDGNGVRIDIVPGAPHPDSYGHVNALDEAALVDAITAAGDYVVTSHFTSNRSLTGPVDTPPLLTRVSLLDDLKADIYRWEQEVTLSCSSTNELVLWVIAYRGPPTYSSVKVLYSAPFKIEPSKVCSLTLKAPIDIEDYAIDANPAEIKYALVPLLSGATVDLSGAFSVHFSVGEFVGVYDNSIPVPPTKVTYYDSNGMLRTLASGTDKFVDYFGSVDYSKSDDPNASVRGIYSQILGNEGKELGDAILRLRMWAATLGTDIDTAYNSLGLTGGLITLQTPGNWLRSDGPFAALSATQTDAVLVKLVHDLVTMKKFMGAESTGVEVIRTIFSTL